MATQGQKRLQTTRAETPSPFEEATRAVSIPAWRDWDRWLRVLGVAVALVGGVMCSVPNAVPLALYVMMPLVVGGVSAALLRSWWAILVVPVAFRVGFLLAGLPLAGGFDSVALGSSQATFEVLATLYGLQLVAVAVGITIGTLTGKVLEQRLRQQAVASTPLNRALS